MNSDINIYKKKYLRLKQKGVVITFTVSPLDDTKTSMEFIKEEEDDISTLKQWIITEFKLDDTVVSTDDIDIKKFNGTTIDSLPSNPNKQNSQLFFEIKPKKLSQEIPTMTTGFSIKPQILRDTRILPDGTILTGTFRDHKLIEGKVTYIDGTTHEGKFIENLLAKGKKINNNGIIQEGTFSHDGYLSNGIIKYNGKIEEGTFSDGYLIKGKKIDNENIRYSL